MLDPITDPVDGRADVPAGVPSRPLTEADRAGMFVPGDHRSLGAYLRSIWMRRSYLAVVPRSELAGQQMNTVLGNLWHLLNPALLIATYYIVFGVVLDGVRRGTDNYLAFLGIGVFVFQYTQRATMSGATSLPNNLGLIRSIAFPRAMLPIAAVIRETLAHLPAVVVMLLTVLLTGEPVRSAWALLPAALALQVVLNTGFALVAARLNHTVGDTQNILPFLFRLLFYGSGVLFVVDTHVSARWSPLFTWNPLYDFIEINRWILMGTPLASATVLSAVLWSVVSALGGIIWFRKDEAFYGASN